MDSNHNSSEEAKKLKASLENLRAELSYAKAHNADWYEAFLKRIDATNNNLKRLQRTITWFGWIFLLITLAVLATLVNNDALSIPSWESVVSLWIGK